MILHCMEKTIWEDRKKGETWGQENLEKDGFIHCSLPEYFWQVVSFYEETKEEIVILCIDEKRLHSKVRYESPDEEGRVYPHVYGLINNNAVINIFPFLRDENGKYVKNQELLSIEDK